MPSLVGSHSLEWIPPSLTWTLLYGLEFIILILQINHTSSLTCKHTDSKELALFIVIKENLWSYLLVFSMPTCCTFIISYNLRVSHICFLKWKVMGRKITHKVRIQTQIQDWTLSNRWQHIKYLLKKLFIQYLWIYGFWICEFIQAHHPLCQVKPDTTVYQFSIAAQ